MVERGDAEGRRPVKTGAGVAAVVMLAVLMMPTAAARAQNGGGPGANPRWQQFQHARHDACSFKSVGTVCTFSFGGKKYTGSCQPAGQGPMVCRNAVGHHGLDYNDPIYNGLSVRGAPY